MRFVLAVVLFLAAAATAGAGLAQRTIWAPPDRLTLSAETDTPATITVIDGAVLNEFDGRQTIDISGSPQIQAAYGRTSDVMAWVGEARYNEIGFEPETTELTTRVAGGDELEVPPLAGSDLWTQDFTQENRLNLAVNLPEDVSVIIASDGVAPAPSDLSITWPLDDSTPFSTPLIIAGAALLVLGLIALLWAIVHLRRSRGPRRKQPKLPRPPRQQRYKPRPRAVAAAKGRRSIRSFVALPASLLAVLVIAAGVPQAATAAPEQTASARTATDDPGDDSDGSGDSDGSDGSDGEEPPVVEPELPPTAVTEPQLRRIVQRVSESVAAADAARDPALADDRLAGPALEFRTTSYAIRGVDANLGALPAIPATEVQLALPQQGDTWPRTVMAVVQDPAAPSVSTALVLIQDDARSQYRVHYEVVLEPEARIPDVAPASVGAARYLDDVKLLTLPPAELPTAYADILAQGAASPYAPLFDLSSDGLVAQIGVDKKNERKAAIPSTATIEFANSVGTGETIALATNNAGALVTVSLTDSETVKPAETNATINTENSIKALLGKGQTTKGYTANYGIQLLFYVPPVAEGGLITLLGYSSSLISAAELP